LDGAARKRPNDNSNWPEEAPRDGTTVEDGDVCLNQELAADPAVEPPGGAYLSAALLD